MKKLMIDMLKQTSDYRCGNVAYTDHAHPAGISVYSKGASHGAFHSPQLATMFKSAGFSTFCHYNENDNRVELTICGN